MDTITKTLNFFSTVKNKDTLLRFFQFMNRVIINALGNSFGQQSKKKNKHNIDYLFIYFIIF